MVYKLGQNEAASDLVRRFHYSHRPIHALSLCATAHVEGGLFGDFGEAVAACVFSVPPTRWGADVWELSRLVRTPEWGGNLTQLISFAVHWIARKGEVDLLVSFADSTEGHHGGIYQAASWHFDGKRNPACTGLEVNGRFIPGRLANNLYGTRSAKLLRQRHPTWTVEEVWDTGKYLYWKPLGRSGRRKARALGLKSNPYPKPAEGLGKSEGLDKNAVARETHEARLHVTPQPLQTLLPHPLPSTSYVNVNADERP